MRAIPPTKGYGAYGSSLSSRVGAYQTAASQPKLFQTIRLLDDLLGHIEAAHRYDAVNRIADEYSSVQAGVMVLQGLIGMLDLRHGRVAENLKKTYMSLIKALLGVSTMVGSQGQYLRLHSAALELRNAWASIVGVSPTSTPDHLREAGSQQTVAVDGAVDPAFAPIG